MRVQLNENNIISVHFEYNPKLVSIVKGIPGRAFNAKARFWYFQADGALPETLKTLRNAGFDIDPKLEELGRGFIPPGRIKEPINDLNASDLPILKYLYPFQKEIVDFMVTNGSCLNASFVGAGKTVTALAACESLSAAPVLIVAPKTLVYQWRKEIKKWLPNMSYVVVSGTTAERKFIYKLANYKYVVVGYETARIDLDNFFGIKWGCIIADEAHRLANPSTKLYRALKFLRTDCRFALTATPILNKATDAWGVLNWIRPGCLGAFRPFVDRYTVRDLWGSVKYYKNLPELAERIRPFIIRKTLEEAKLQLPDKVEEFIPVVLSDRERNLYDKVKAELLFDIDRADLSKLSSPVILQNGIVKLGKLFELCDSLELIGDSAQSSKLEALKEHLEGVLVNGQKAIIITRFERMADILFKELADYSPLKITGRTLKRQDIISSFENRSDHRILIGTEAIGQGLNLQIANILYNYDLPWNPARLEQRAGRIHRQGQDKPVFIYNLVVENSVETWLKKKIEKKAELSNSLLPKNIIELKEALTS